MKVRFRITVGAAQPFDWEFSGYQFRVGRDPDCQLSFTADGGDAVSWQHAKIVLFKDGLEVSDLGSTNGTYVNGKRVQKETAFRAGDVLLFGLSGPRIEVVEYVDPEALHTAVPVAVPVQAAAAPASAAPVATVTKSQPPRSATAAAGASQNRVVLFAFIVAGGVLGTTAGFVVLRNLRGDSAAQDVASTPVTHGGPTAVVAPTVTPARTTVPSPAESPWPTAPATPPLPQLSVAQIVERNKSAVVWVGIKVIGAEGNDGVRFPMAPGWVASPQHVVTTGMHAENLRKLAADYAGKTKLFICLEGEPRRFFDAREIRVHERYKPDASDPDFTHFNLGVVRLEQPLPQACTIAGNDDLRYAVTRESGRCVVAGWAISHELQAKSAAGVFLPTVELPATLADVAPAGDDVKYPKRDLTGVSFPEGSGGCPVFDLRGKVLGTISQVGQRSVVISAQLVRPMLD